MSKPMSDEDLMRDLQHWGGKECPAVNCDALRIQQHSIEKSHANRRLVMAIGICLAMIVASIGWLSQWLAPSNSKSDVALRGTQIHRDPKKLLEAINARTEQIAQRAHGLQVRLIEKQRSAREYEVIHSEIVKLRRVAIRNQIVLNSTPTQSNEVQ